jgi:hypothetical protein
MFMRGAGLGIHRVEGAYVIRFRMGVFLLAVLLISGIRSVSIGKTVIRKEHQLVQGSVNIIPARGRLSAVSEPSMDMTRIRHRVM